MDITFLVVLLLAVVMLWGVGLVIAKTMRKGVAIGSLFPLFAAFISIYSVTLIGTTGITVAGVAQDTNTGALLFVFMTILSFVLTFLIGMKRIS